MASNNWNQRFLTTILNRGREYFKNGCVEELECDEQRITAVVSGSYDYDVEINFDGTQIGSMTCDCPYAEDGYNCKHMAAVLYAWENQSKKSDSGHKNSEKEISVKDAVQMLSEETVRMLLMEYAEKDRKLRDHILISATGSVSQKQQNSWKRELMRLKKTYGVGYDNYLDYLIVHTIIFRIC